MLPCKIVWILLSEHLIFFSIIEIDQVQSLSHRYNTRWYVAPLRIQKLVLLLLQRGNKPFHLTFAKVFVASLEGFATVRSISFFFNKIHSTTRRLETRRHKEKSLIAANKCVHVLLHCHVFYATMIQMSSN